MANTMIKWVTFTYYMFGTIICVSLYLLQRYTTVNVIEEENMFTRSPNAVSKAVPITMVSSFISELPPKVDIDYELKNKEFLKDNKSEESDGNEEARKNAILLLNEIVAVKISETDDDGRIQELAHPVVL